MNRPQTTVVLGMTADGKITDKALSPARFGSQADKLHLERQISFADAVIFGAGTLRSYGTTLPITNLELLETRKEHSQQPQPFQIVCSASGKLNPQLRFFSQPVPRWLLTTPTGAEFWRERTEFERIIVSRSDRHQEQIANSLSMEWDSILSQLKQLGIDKLAILGGGQLIASLLAVDVVDEFYLTICPVIFGGKDTPTAVEGRGWLQQQGRKLELVSVKQVDQEVFLHYKTIR
ncbi:MAG: RibD family protein [Xenococcaceae cyanobacterium MO_188.B29]|nr:RibD family protein [Xenococcaceae cyanobacterium MO_188.B29]